MDYCSDAAINEKLFAELMFGEITVMTLLRDINLRELLSSTHFFSFFLFNKVCGSWKLDSPSILPAASLGDINEQSIFWEQGGNWRQEYAIRASFAVKWHVWDFKLVSSIPSLSWGPFLCDHQSDKYTVLWLLATCPRIQESLWRRGSPKPAHPSSFDGSSRYRGQTQGSETCFYQTTLTTHPDTRLQLWGAPACWHFMLRFRRGSDSTHVRSL